MKRIFLIILTSFLFSYSYSQTTYYISSSTGNDSNNGTSSATPWKTLKKIMKGAYVGGDSILFKGGDVFIGQIEATDSTFDAYGDTTAKISNTSSAHPVVFSSYGTGRAIINSTSFKGSGSDDAGIDVYDVGGVVIQNLILQGTSGMLDSAYLGVSAGVQFYTSLRKNTRLSYVKVQNIVDSGYDVGVLMGGNAVDSTASGYDSVYIINDTLFNLHEQGIDVYGKYGHPNGFTIKNVVIQGNVIYNVFGLTAVQAGASNTTGLGIEMGETQKAIIENNVVHDNGTITNQSPGPNGIYIYDCDSITVQFNEVYNQSTLGTNNGGGFDFDGGTTNSIMQYNYSHNNYGAGFMFLAYNDFKVTTWNNNTMRYNISQNDVTHNTTNYSSISVSGTSNLTNAYIYNNTVYKNNVGNLIGISGGSFINSGYVSNNIFYGADNNIIVTTYNATAPPSTFKFVNNDYYTGNTTPFSWGVSTTYSSLSSWQTATTQETFNSQSYGMTVNPLLVNPGSAGNANGYTPSVLNGYKLQSNSPLINAGISIQSLFGITPGTQDYFGVTIPQNNLFDVGASETPHTNNVIVWKKGNIGKYPIKLVTNKVDTVYVPTGKIARFNFTNDSTQNVLNWNQCYLPLVGDSALYVIPIDANTNFSVHVYGNQNISGKYWGANSKPPVDTGQGYSSIFSKAIDSAFWFNFVNIGNTFPFVPNMFISGLNPDYFYKIQYISATQGNTNDYRFYSGVIFQNGNNIADTTQTGYVNGIGKGNTIQTIVSPLIQCNSSGVLNMQLGYYANAYVGYGIISGMIITEYMKE